jgi:hypothetical protein
MFHIYSLSLNNAIYYIPSIATLLFLYIYMMPYIHNFCSYSMYIHNIFYISQIPKIDKNYLYEQIYIMSQTNNNIFFYLIYILIHIIIILFE